MFFHGPEIGCHKTILTFASPVSMVNIKAKHKQVKFIYRLRRVLCDFIDCNHLKFAH